MCKDVFVCICRLQVLLVVEKAVGIEATTRV